MLPVCSVYGLYSTENREIRYIGQTTQPLRGRLVQHLAEAARPPGTSRCHRWIRSVLRSGFKIGIELIEAGCPWDEAEKRWIALYHAKNPGRMTNLAAGGAGYVGKRSMETRMKMRKPKSESHKANMRGKPKSPEHRAKLILANMGNARGRGERNGQAVLSEANVIDIKSRLLRGESLSRIAAIHGVTKAAVWKIKDGRSWRHLQSAPAVLCEDHGRHGERGDGDPRGSAREAAG